MKDCRRIPVPSRVSAGKFLLEFAILALGSLGANVSLGQKSTAPPVAPLRVVTEEYFGTKVADLRVQVQANGVSVTSAWLKPMWGNGALPLRGRV